MSIKQTDYVRRKMVTRGGETWSNEANVWLTLCSRLNDVPEDKAIKAFVNAGLENAGAAKLHWSNLEFIRGTVRNGTSDEKLRSILSEAILVEYIDEFWRIQKKVDKAREAMKRINTLLQVPPEREEPDLYEMSREAQAAYTDILCDIYEKAGFEPVLVQEYACAFPEEDAPYEGKPFIVVGRNNFDNGEVIRPAWDIVFEDGHRMTAYPGEIARAVTWGTAMNEERHTYRVVACKREYLDFEFVASSCDEAKSKFDKLGIDAELESITDETGYCVYYD